jgi:hypothetical protein
MNLEFIKDLKAGLYKEIKSLLEKQKHAEVIALQSVCFAIDYAIEKEVERQQRIHKKAIEKEIFFKKSISKERKRLGMDDDDWGIVGH